MLASRRAGRVQQQADDDPAEDRRLLDELFALAVAPQAARDLRTYGIAGPIGALHAAMGAQVRSRALRAALRAAAWEALGWLVFAAGFVTAIVVLVVRAAHGHASPGGVVMAVFGGQELSGGQWQRISLARGLMRAEPLLVVLDEPAAALDAAAERALFERYVRAARASAAAARAVTLLVTHRFSTARIADLIVVLDAGRVLEVGSHDELMRAGGTYAELFELQARAYRDD